SYVKSTLLTGSYQRNTMIRPVNDVDLFVVLEDYEEPHEIPSPKVILQRLKRELDKKFPNSPIREDKPCVVVACKHCKFKLTPAFRLNSFPGSHYRIPQLSNSYGWQVINTPEILEREIAYASVKKPLLIPLIKMMKRCKQFNKHKTPPSFQM